MDPTLEAKYANDPLAQALLRDGLAIQERFVAEPIYAKTGKGYLKPASTNESAVGSDETTNPSEHH